MNASFAQLPPAERFTQTVPELKVIETDRRNWLAQNPEGKSPVELNRQIPEINEIELDNGIAKAASHQAKLASGRKSLRVAAWNGERGRYWREAAQLIKTHPALKQIDVWCLSEMDNGMARAQNEHTTRELALVLGMNYAYSVEFLQLSVGTPREQALYAGENLKGYHGNAILTRFPLQNVRMLRFSGIAKWYGSFEHRLGGRNAILADIQVEEQWITIASTHLESGSKDDAKRAEEGQLILQELSNTRDRPVILGGDLNSVHTAPVVETFRKAGFSVDDCNDLGQSTYQEVVEGRIQPGLHHIDYLMARGAVVRLPKPTITMAAYPCEPTGKLLSDHAIVTASFSW